MNLGLLRLNLVSQKIRYGYVKEAWPASYYQTVYVTEMGSAEMPSAGRPFTPDLITRLVARGVQVAPLILSWMIWRTLLIPHTMAATGLFYIALLGVFVGEILGRQILALTSLPF